MNHIVPPRLLKEGPRGLSPSQLEFSDQLFVWVIRNAYWRIDGAIYVASRLSEVGPAVIYNMSLEAITEFFAIWRFSGMGSPTLARPKQDELTPDEISILELRRQVWHPSGHPPLGRASMLVGIDSAAEFIEHLAVIDSCISMVLASLTGHTGKPKLTPL